MKTLVWTGPRQMEWKDTDMPMPNSGEVLIKVSKVGICGSELSGYLGENSLRMPPLIMGHEFSGIVVDKASDVQAWTNGDLVTVNPLLSCHHCKECLQGYRQFCSERSIIGIHRAGAFAQYVAVPATACYKVRNDVIGALTEPLACSVRACELAQIGLNDQVVVFGAGIIGLMALKVAELSGASTRIIIDTNTTRLEKAKQWGATHLVQPQKGDVEQEIAQLTGGGADKVIDAVGLPVTRKQGIQLLRNGGTIIFIGLHEDDSTVPGNLIVRKEIQVKGSFCYSDHNFQTALSLLENDKLPAVSAWLDIRPMKDGKAAFDEQIDGTAPFPKIMLEP